jgi:hypothetical protein
LSISAPPLLFALLIAASPEPPQKANAGPEKDKRCLDTLREAGVRFEEIERRVGVRTPIKIEKIGDLTFTALGRHRAIMDCDLARGFVDALPIFRRLDVKTLWFSAAYDFRMRRDKPVPSNHSRGLAIDVHRIKAIGQELTIETHFERSAKAGASDWRRLYAGPGAEGQCVGKPQTPEGTLLRRLVCALKLRSAFRIVVTPDDNAAHADHLHLEVYPSRYDYTEIDRPSGAGETAVQTSSDTPQVRHKGRSKRVQKRMRRAKQQKRKRRRARRKHP